MNANIFFAGSFFCAISALCIGQMGILKIEALCICVGLGFIGSILLKFGLDALHLLQERNNDLSIQIIDTASKKIDSIEQRLLQNISERKENINFLCRKNDEKQFQLIQTLSEQKEVLQTLRNSIVNIENYLKLKHEDYKTTAKKTEQMHEEIIVQLQKENGIITDWKNDSAKNRESILKQTLFIGDCVQKQLKEIKNISAELVNIIDSLNSLVDKTEGCEKTVSRQRSEVADFIKEIEELVGDLNEVLTELQKEFVEQNEANRKQISTYHERYADVTEKDIDIINKIYNGLKK